jgi:hypothetical protein
MIEVSVKTSEHWSVGAVSKYTAVCTNSTCAVNLGFMTVGDNAPAFCPQWGSGVLENCPSCSEEIESPDNKFCSKCGQRLRFDPDPKTGKVTVILRD